MTNGRLLKLTAAATAVLIALCGCAPAVVPGDDPDVPDVPDTPEEPDTPEGPDMPEEPQDGITLTSVYGGGIVPIYGDAVREYLTAPYEEQPEVLLEWYNTGEGSLINQFIAFSWDYTEDEAPYTVTFSQNEDLSEGFSFVTDQESLSVGVFIPGVTYYWNITSASGAQSATDSFVPEDLDVRFVTVGGLDNIRDLGGWRTESGKSVKYGMIYRGTQLNGYANGPTLTDEGRKVFEILGINSEIDIRTPGVDDKDQMSNLTSGSGAYLKAPFYAYTCILPEFDQIYPTRRNFDERVPLSIRAIFEFLADESNYPVYIHCNAGADRTGTIAFLISGLLGVGYEDLTADFELTSFAGAGRRWRGDLTRDDLGNGVMQDDSSNYVAWDKMYDYMLRYYGTPGGTLSAAIRNYLSSVCGVSADMMDAVCDIMLED